MCFNSMTLLICSKHVKFFWRSCEKLLDLAGWQSEIAIGTEQSSVQVKRVTVCDFFYYYQFKDLQVRTP